MKAVRGHFDGSVVVLDEPAPQEGPVEVIVQFPEPSPRAPSPSEPKKWHWEEADAFLGSLKGSASEELMRQRGRQDVSPAGLPSLPPEAERKERAARLEALIREWAEEPPSDDLATFEELQEGLRANPVRFREFRVDE